MRSVFTWRALLAPLVSLVVGCQSGVLVTIDAEPELRDELSGFAVTVAGWNQSEGAASRPETECFAAGDLPLEVGIHAGDEPHDFAVLRIAAQRSERLWFVFEELLILGEGVEDHTVTLGDDCMSCDGRFCSGSAGCSEVSSVGVFHDELDELADLCE